jgi:outer membrane protein assembly factor BamB
VLRNHFSCVQIVLGFAVLSSASMVSPLTAGEPAGAGSWEVRLTPVEGDVQLPTEPTENLKQREADIRGWLRKQHPKLEDDDPGLRALGWLLARHTRNKDGDYRIAGKYYNIGVKQFNDYQSISGAIAMRNWSKAYGDGLRREYAELMIELRVPKSVVHAVRRINGMPAGKEVRFTTTDDLHAKVAQAYPKLADATAIEQARWWLALASVNPALDDGRFYRITTDQLDESHPHIAVPLSGKRVHVVVFKADRSLPVLLPPEHWMSTAAKQQAVPGWKQEDARIASAKIWELKLPNVGQDKATLHLYLVMRKGLVENAYALLPTVHNRPQLVKPIPPVEEDPAAIPTKPFAEKALPPLEPAANTLDGEGQLGEMKRTSEDMGHPKPSQWLTVDRGELKGSCIVMLNGGGDDAPRLEVEFDGSLKGNRASGDFTATDDRGEKQPKSTGVFTGRLLPTDPPGVNQLPGDRSWPQWGGPIGNNVATSGDSALVADLCRARVQWVSDAFLPEGRGLNLRGNVKKLDRGEPPMGGAASPVAKDGRLYLSYFQPAGETYALDAGQQAAKAGRDAFLYRVNKIEADDVVLAMHAETGRTLWKRVFDRAALNWVGFNKAVPAMTPVAWRDRVFAVGNTGRVYCLDAATGEVLWQSDIGRRHLWMEGLRDHLLATNSYYSSRSDFASSPTVADGVLVVNNHQRSKTDYRYEVDNGLVAFDVMTGRTLWRIPECSQGDPVLWNHDGRQYILAFGRDGARCIDPRSGEVLWHQPEAMGGHIGVGLNSDYLVCDGEFFQAEGNKWARSVRCFKITPTGAELYWELPREYTGSRAMPVIVGDKVYVHVRYTKPKLLCVDLHTGKILGTAPRPFATNGEHENAFFLAMDGYLLGAVKRGGYAWTPLDPNRLDQVSSARPDLTKGYVSTCMPAAVDGRLFFRTETRVVAWDLRKPTSVATRPHGKNSSIYSTIPAPAEEDKSKSKTQKEASSSSEGKASGKKKNDDKLGPAERPEPPEPPTMEDMFEDPEPGIEGLLPE